PTRDEARPLAADVVEIGRHQGADDATGDKRPNATAREAPAEWIRDRASRHDQRASAMVRELHAGLVLDLDRDCEWLQRPFEPEELTSDAGANASHEPL